MTLLEPTRDKPFRVFLRVRELLGSHASTRLDGAGTHGPVRRSAHDQRAV